MYDLPLLYSFSIVTWLLPYHSSNLIPLLLSTLMMDSSFLLFILLLNRFDVGMGYGICAQYIFSLYSCTHCFSCFFTLVIDDKDNILSNLQIFNEFNARKPDEFNIFKGVTRNYLFMGIIGLTVVLQVSLVNGLLVVFSLVCEIYLRTP